MKFTGKITDYLETQGTSKDGKSYVVRKWRIEETDGQYPNSIMVESFNKDFGNAKEGDTVDVEFNTKCDKYEGKLYNKLSAWKISVLSQGAKEAAPSPGGGEKSNGPIPEWAAPKTGFGEPAVETASGDDSPF